MDILVKLGELRVVLAKLISHSDAKLTFCKGGRFDKLLKTWPIFWPKEESLVKIATLSSYVTFD